MFAPKFKARAPTGSGVWTPKSQTPYGSSSELDIGSSAAPTPPPPPTRPVWTPQPSPALSGRKEFRPVHFESPTLPRRYTANQQLQQQQQQQTTTTIPPWSYTNGNCPAPAPRSSTTTNLSTPTTLNSNNSDYAETDYSNQFGPVAPSSSVSDKIKTFERSASTSELHRPFTRRQLADTSRAVYRPNEVTRPSYKSNGYVSEPEPNYDSDYSTLKYRTPNPLRVQSISSAVNVRNLNQDDKLYGTMPNPIKSAQNSYKNQPGRIENYTTGHSSVSEKEKKEWWDEVMDIFNGNLDQSKLSPLYSEGNLSRALAKESGYTSDSNIVFRKKELAPGSPLSPVEQRQAYKSLQAGGEPPLLGFRKPAPEKPKEIVEEFEFIQITPTLTKIRVSTKPLEESKEEVQPANKKPTPPSPPPPPPPPTAADKMFSNFSKNLPSFIPLSKKQQQQQETPPLPPNRRSSCTKSTVRMEKVTSNSSCSKSRHDQCFQPPGGTNSLTLRKVATSCRREPICRSKSTGAVSTLLATLTATKETRNKDGSVLRQQHHHQHHARLRSASPSRRPSNRVLALRHSSRSPVAFGRSISKERSFAEEKKRLENTLPLSRTNFEASTNILRDPSLKSPQEVREAVRSYATCKAQHTRSKSLPRLRHSSTVSTTTRHTMCFPQVRPQHLLDCSRALKKVLPSRCTKAPTQSIKTIATVHRSASNESLPRSNSTYSIESQVRQEYAAPIAPPKTYVGKSNVPLQMSRSESHVPRKRTSASQTKTPKSKKPPASVASYSETVREKTHFWNDYNAKQKSQVPHSLPQLINDYKYSSLVEPAVYGEDIYDYSGQGPPSCIEDLVWQYENKSQQGNKAVAAATAAAVTDVAPHAEVAQVVQVGQRRFSPTREVRVPQTPQRELRSPSRRRIDSLRSSQRSQEKADQQAVVRASSLSSADDRSKRAQQASAAAAGNGSGGGLYQCGELAHSATSLTYLERHSPSCRYRNNCERFTELNRFYSTLERVGQLERATSASNFHPLRKDAELLDFDEWRKVRLHERAEKELQYLVGKLQMDQRERDLHFRSKDVNELKWRHEADQALHAKKKSVEDLRENFEQLQLLKQQQREEAQLPPIQRQWRRNTVADLASSLELTREPQSQAQTDRHLSNDLVSTLSKDQIKKITQQLNEIYAGNRKSTAGAVEEEEQFVVTVEKGSKPSSHANTLKVRCNSNISKEQLLGPVLRKREEQSQMLPRPTRSQSPVVVARETRGAIAAKNAELTLCKPPPEVPPRPQPKAQVTKQPKVAAAQLHESKEPPINQKIQYFEERQFEEPSKTIYHAREDSSPDEAEVMRLIEQNMQARQLARKRHIVHTELSNSLTDLSGIYGERPAARVNFHLHSPPDRPPEGSQERERERERELEQEVLQERQVHQEQELSYEPGSGDGSIELYDAYYRSRSLSPQSQISACSSSYLQRVYTGEVQKMKQKFESIERDQSNERRDFFGLSSLRKARSDPDLQAGSKDAPSNATDALLKENTKPSSDVTHLTHTFEVRGATPSPDRGRRRQRGLLMPHIDIISKTAELLPTCGASPTRSHSSNSGATVGQVQTLRNRYESPESAPQRYLSTSLADLRDVHESISPHLSGDWVAHKHPQRTPALPKKPLRHTVVRASSTSPLRPAKLQTTSYDHDFFANQPFEPHKHRPKARYVPDGADASNPTTTTTTARRCPVSSLERLKRSMAVTFKDFDSSAAPPIPPQPLQNHPSYEPYTYSNGDQIDSGTDVNIHFKTPIRHEYKQNLSEEELAIRQAEHMQKLYQEERRRKYLQELQDMNSRRHTDNFTPSQKSPIALNRYDDFPTDVTLKSLVGPKTVARALYNFQGQTSKELSFRKGDTIYIRRQIDPNWYEGEHNAMIGLLPASYVEIVSRDGARTPSKRPSEGQARAKYNFQAQSGVELSLNKGELVTLTRRVDGNWFEGKIANRKGIFPVSYVEVLTDIGAEDIAARTTTVISTQSTTNLRPNLDVMRTNINQEFNTLTQNGAHPPNGILKETRQLHKTDALHVDTSSEPVTYRALYKYRPQNSDELEVLEGDLVHVLEKCDDGWFVGTSQRTGCFGTFPGNYVERA
ncbi:GH21781 [Drosophila grimshawi]|uniref:GH21781 n=1 Tax=Drosophila grimshawi TaxID=7222 RepID=B4J6X0_DROGR|nr:GH21781 [Drosophila grimshawi]